MMNTNLLDLNNDILNIIGDYVKKENEYRIYKEDNFKEADKGLNYLKKKKKFIGEELMVIIYCHLYKSGVNYDEIIEYITSRNLLNILNSRNYYS